MKDQWPLAAMFVLLLGGGAYQVSLGGAFGWAAVALLVAFAAVWLLSVVLRDTSVVDVFWGPSFLLAAIVYGWVMGLEARGWLILVLVALWSLRLAAHIGWRSIGAPEDRRYGKMRAQAGDRWWWQSFFTVFVFQAALAWVISGALYFAIAGEAAMGWLDALAVGVWLLGFAFEVGGDWQLSRFKKTKRDGDVLNTGFWALTRHPNYFGDACQWVAYYLLAVAAGAPQSLYAPVLMILMLLRISGVTMLEDDLAARKPQYRDYIASTPAFVPWPWHVWRVVTR